MKSEIDLMKELIEEKKYRQTLEYNVIKYQEAFTWLKQQKWFADNRHKLKKYINEVKM